MSGLERIIRNDKGLYMNLNNSVNGNMPFYGGFDQQKLGDNSMVTYNNWGIVHNPQSGPLGKVKLKS